ncbi:UDP-N-acetylmuramate dehydrogenase [Methylococcus sp. EFPC2]|uniref:UDP-N-acetylmuramate dehydrogenase n=1 Tax=Methylococcus sp. EFPC2 TaxID=2812648 RepID=UPI0019671B33|nr:UDP-N-acetylmuramate dehydrogenase [Methylococcus sp. EFPC2]QSA95924.1 UDP-N-acetylmuramate dehydrogenase [Methylococcus sp. EFPC2]
MVAELPVSSVPSSGPRWRGELRHDEPLSEHTSWRVGGPADHLYWPADRQDLLDYLQALPVDEPLFWLGLGSNLLVRDGGLRGTVICTRGCLRIMYRADESHIYVEAGVACAQVARYCAEQNLGGAEFLAGIPGTLGGALVMNAGAFGGETWTLVEKVHTTDRFGTVHERRPEEYQVGYRHVVGPPEYFLAAELKLQTGDTAESRERIRELLARRSATQPTHQPSCGSVFRNPPGDHAARLIEACGLKGFHIGGACVSEKHANFIVNLGYASADDIERLIEHVRNEVERHRGIRLETEVRIVGEPAPESAGEIE